MFAMRLLLVSALLFSGVAAASNPSFAPEDVFSLTWASDPQVSPDGTFIIFTYNYMDIMHRFQGYMQMWHVRAAMYEKDHTITLPALLALLYTVEANSF